MTDITHRWSEVVSASASFTQEQIQRVQAIRVAREVCEQREPGKGPFTIGGVSAGTPWLIETAQWIVDGTLPPVPAEEATS